MEIEVSTEAGEGHSGRNRRTALIIAVLALCLSISETLGKGAQTEALSANVEASNLWGFYQAKTLRQTTLKVASDTLKIQSMSTTAPEAREAIEGQLGKWADTIARYESEPATGEGRKELMARAKAAEESRDHSLAAYHQFELASAALQIAVVLASAQIITGATFLLWIVGVLGITGLAFCAIGFFAPLALQLF